MCEIFYFAFSFSFFLLCEKHCDLTILAVHKEEKERAAKIKIQTKIKPEEHEGEK